MRNVVKVLGTGLLLAAVTACGAANTGGAGAPPTAAPTSSAPPLSTVPAPPPGSTGVGRPTQGVPPGDQVLAQGQVDVGGLPEGYPRTVYVGGDDRTLVLQAEEGGCKRVSARLGDQTDKQVVVLVTVTTAPKGQMCPDYLREITIPLKLADPLGTRTVVLRQG